jgi:Flp pilus assembly protein TadG
MTVEIARGSCQETTEPLTLFSSSCVTMKNQKGVAAVELALIAPLLLLLVFGIVQLGYYWTTYVMVAQAAAAGARYFSAANGSQCPVTCTVSQIKKSAGTLNTANMTFAFTVAGNSSSCTTGGGDTTACETALSNAYSATGQSGNVSVTVNYSFTPLLAGYTFGLASPTTMSVTQYASVQP